MVIVGHMSSKSAFGAKNTGQKFLTPKNFWWCRNVCHDSCPGVIFGAGRGGAAPSFSGAGRGRVENFRGRGAPGQPFPPGPGRGGAGRGVHPWWVLSLWMDWVITTWFFPLHPFARFVRQYFDHYRDERWPTPGTLTNSLLNGKR